MRAFSAIITSIFLLTVAMPANAKASISMILVENHANVAECKASVGCVIKTSGYYVSGDEGDAEYNVVKDEGKNAIDGKYIIKLKNGLLAKMNAKDGYINIKSFGCKTQDEDPRFDNTVYFQEVANIATAHSYAIFVPIGDFLVNGTVILPKAAKIIGYHGYSFRKSSRLIQTVQPLAGEDNIVMFKGANNDALWHITVDGVTFMRDRTKDERRIYNDGMGYGIKSTVFGSSTELSLTNCGFIGWGHCFDNAAILFSIRTDYSYCDNILYSKSGFSSSVVIQDANIWCCGHLVRLDKYACTNITFSNSWMEGLQSLLLAESSTRLENLNFSGCTISPMSYGAGHSLIEYPQKPSWNVVLVSFSQCMVKVPCKIATDLTPMAYKVSLTDCSVHYFGEGENVIIEGNSTFWEGDKGKKSNKIRQRASN